MPNTEEQGTSCDGADYYEFCCNHNQETVRGPYWTVRTQLAIAYGMYSIWI